MTVTYVEDDTTKTAEITASGHLTREDYEKVIPQMQAFIDRHGTIKFVEILESFKGFDPTLLWSGIKFDMRNIQHISHVAIVSDVGWISPFSTAAGAFLSTKLRTFSMAEVDAARAWVKSPEA